MPVQPFAFRELPTTDQAGATRNFEQLMALLNPVWVKPVLEHAWVNNGEGFQEARYTKDLLGFAVIEGVVKSGEFEKSVFLLPIGFRPGADLVFPESGNNLFATIQIKSTGAVVAKTGAGPITLNCRFRAEN